MNRPSTAEPKRTCNQCGKILHGRADQRYCNDGCRNTYNRHKREQERLREHGNVPEIFRIIKKNYEILRSLHAEAIAADETLMVPKEQLIKAGFNSKFYTSTWNDDDEATWKFCFERGWVMGETNCHIIDRQEQAAI
jgi:predicted nucleic acid-binding Zn ribbon protein